MILRIPDVLARIKVSRSTLYAMMERGQFPRPIKVGDRLNGWTERQVEKWEEQLESSAER